MPQFVAQWSYTASRDGRVIGPFTAGTVVHLDDEDVEWVKRDSPGVLGPVPKVVLVGEKGPEILVPGRRGKKAGA